VFGAESPFFADPDFIRAIARTKSCTDLPYNPRPEYELPRHLLHAIYPGMGNSMEGMKRLAPLLRRLSAATFASTVSSTLRRMTDWESLCK